MYMCLCAYAYVAMCIASWRFSSRLTIINYYRMIMHYRFFCNLNDKDLVTRNNYEFKYK